MSAQEFEPFENPELGAYSSFLTWPTVPSTSQWLMAEALRGVATAGPKSGGYGVSVTGLGPKATRNVYSGGRQAGFGGAGSPGEGLLMAGGGGGGGGWSSWIVPAVSALAGAYGSYQQARGGQAAAAASGQPTTQWTDPRYPADIEEILRASREFYAQGLPPRPVPGGGGPSADTRAALEALRGRALGADPTVAAGQDYIQRGLADPYGGNILTRSLAESLMGGGSGDFDWANAALRGFTGQDPLSGYTPGAGYQTPVGGYTPGRGYDVREQYNPATGRWPSGGGPGAAPAGRWSNAPVGTTTTQAEPGIQRGKPNALIAARRGGGDLVAPTPGGGPGGMGPGPKGPLGTGNLFGQYAEQYLNLEESPHIEALLEAMRPSHERNLQSALADVEARAEGVGRLGSDVWSDARAEATQRALEEWNRAEGQTRLEDLGQRRELGFGTLGLLNTRDISQEEINAQRAIADANRAAASAEAGAARQAAAQAAAMQYELGMRGLDVEEMLGTRGLDLQEALGFRGQNLEGLLGALGAGQGNRQLLAGLAGGLDASQLGMAGLIPGITEASYAGLDRFLPLSMQMDRQRASGANARALAEWQNAMLPQQNLESFAQRIFGLADRYDTRYGQSPQIPYTGPNPATAGILGALGGFFAGGGAEAIGNWGGPGGSTSTPGFNPNASRYVPDPQTGSVWV